MTAGRPMTDIQETCAIACTNCSVHLIAKKLTSLVCMNKILQRFINFVTMKQISENSAKCICDLAFGHQ